MEEGVLDKLAFNELSDLAINTGLVYSKRKRETLGLRFSRVDDADKIQRKGEE